LKNEQTNSQHWLFVLYHFGTQLIQYNTCFYPPQTVAVNTK